MDRIVKIEEVSKLSAFFRNHCIFTAAFPLVYLILNIVGLTFREVPLFILIGWTILGWIAIFWWWWFKTYGKMSHIKHFVIGTIGIALLLLTILVSAFISLFAYNPDHVVQIDGKKYVAEVRSFTHVNVDYYSYFGPVLRGNRVVIYGYFGRGGFDPYDSNVHGTVKYTFYDDNCNPIETRTGSF
ncbi:hypothetical protein [Pseudobutyrivibrio sp.]|uniref:hypothetical protein n=1 Tax=Pseudobutyrivibrio sp. TaxID=2014367 RepID=UPI0025DCA88D|nr:hypothetical protein [Pseudobutyrivibrio sp.]